MFDLFLPFVDRYFFIVPLKFYVKIVLVMHQSIENPAPRPPGHSGEFNILQVLKNGLFPALGDKAFVKSPA